MSPLRSCCLAFTLVTLSTGSQSFLSAGTIAGCISETEGYCGSAEDLSGDNMDPTDLGVLAPGGGLSNPNIYVVDGSVSEIGDPIVNLDPLLNGTADVFTFEIPDGAQLNEIRLNLFSAATSFIFMGLDDGPTYDISPFDLNNFTGDLTQTLGGAIIGNPNVRGPEDPLAPGLDPAELNPLSAADRTGDLLKVWQDVPATNGSPFDVPLGPGQYSIYIQETSPNSSAYRLSLSVSAIPEPSSLAFLGMVSMGVMLRRRRSR